MQLDQLRHSAHLRRRRKDDLCQRKVCAVVKAVAARPIVLGPPGGLFKLNAATRFLYDWLWDDLSDAKWVKGVDPSRLGPVQFGESPSWPRPTAASPPTVSESVSQVVAHEGIESRRGGGVAEC